MTETRAEMPALDFRRVLGHFPTGVTVVTSSDDDRPIGMVVGSFTSVSLDPPLVAFLPALSSTTFPRIQASGRFCVNVLSSEQEQVCRAFARSDGPKFDAAGYTRSPNGSPLLDDIVAWIDCDIESVIEMGDHYVCVGRVSDLGTTTASAPLIFFRGGYGGFDAASLAAPAEDDLVAHLKHVDLARHEMEQLAARHGGECMASAVVGDELVFMAVAGSAAPGKPATRIGERVPYMAPVAPLFAAFAPPSDSEAWLTRMPRLDPDRKHELQSMLAATRDRGFTVGNTRRAPRQGLFSALAELNIESPGDLERSNVRAAVERLATSETLEEADDVGPADYVGAPIFDKAGRVVLQLTLVGPHLTDADAVETVARELQDSCDRVTRALGGHLPASR